MLVERAKDIIGSQGFETRDMPDALVITTHWLGGAFAASFPVYFKTSPKDGFAIAHVDGKAVRHWLGY